MTPDAIDHRRPRGPVVRDPAPESPSGLRITGYGLRVTGPASPVFVLRGRMRGPPSGHSALPRMYAL